MSADSAVLAPPAPAPGPRVRRAHPLIVVKFGGASLATVVRIRAAANRVRALREAGNAVVIVASARGNTTDRLLQALGNLAPLADASSREADRALATGETLSAALLAAALLAAGVPAASVDPADAVLLAEGPFGNATLRELRAGRLHQLIADGTVPVIPGFQGVRDDGEIVTLGRGSSDVTAVFLASALGARECHLVKDVDGVYDRDPALATDALRFDELSFDGLVALTADGAGVIHSDAALRARFEAVPLRVYRYDAPIDCARATRIGAEAAA